MKATGVTRRVDRVGRVSIPSSIRRNLGIDIEDTVEFFIDKGCIIVKKFEINCTICGSSDNLIKLKDKNICNKCKKGLEDM